MLVKEPIYHQLHQLLHELIRSGEYHTGDKFLTEREIAVRFGVSRTTANKALSSLVSNGTLEFCKGVGTFVRPSVLDYELRSLVSFSEKARAQERTPKTQVLEFRQMKGSEAPGPVRARLGVPPASPLFFVERLRLADETPVVLERRYIVTGLCPQLNRQDLEGSLYGAWTTRHGLTITGANQSIRAVLLSEKDASLLGVETGAAALVVLALGCVEGDQPLWWEETLYRADAYEFHCSLGGLSPALTPIGHFYKNP